MMNVYMCLWKWVLPAVCHTCCIYCHNPSSHQHWRTTRNQSCWSCGYFHPATRNIVEFTARHMQHILIKRYKRAKKQKKGNDSGSNLTGFQLFSRLNIRTVSFPGVSFVRMGMLCEQLWLLLKTKATYKIRLHWQWFGYDLKLGDLYYIVETVHRWEASS